MTKKILDQCRRSQRSGRNAKIPPDCPHGQRVPSEAIQGRENVKKRSSTQGNAKDKTRHTTTKKIFRPPPLTKTKSKTRIIRLESFTNYRTTRELIMADLFRTCPDGHRCEHNSLCVEANEGSYYCDCNTATGDYAGLSCEFAAEDYCMGDDGSTSVWCANQGMCQRSSSNQWYCNCPPEYDGPVSVE